MSHDTDPMGSAPGAERRNDTAPAVAHPARTEPGAPPGEADTDPAAAPVGEDDKPFLAHKVDSTDPGIASLLGRLAPARVAPAIGDTRVTDGHDAAVARVPPRAPPKAHETPTPEAPVIVAGEGADPTGPSDVRPPGSAFEKSVAAGQTLTTVVAPRSPRQVTTAARPRDARVALTPRLVAGAALGIVLTTVGVVVGARMRGAHGEAAAATDIAVTASTSPRNEGAGSSGTAARSASPAVTTLPSAPSSAPVAGPASALPETSPRVSGAPAPAHPVRPAERRDASRTATPAYSSKAPAAPRPSASALPPDIHWTIE